MGICQGCEGFRGRVDGLRLRIMVAGAGAWNLGFVIQGSTLRVQGSGGFRVRGLTFLMQGRVQGLGCREYGIGFIIYDALSRVQDAGFLIQGLGCRVQGLGFRVQGKGSRVQDSGFKIHDLGSVTGFCCFSFSVQSSGLGLGSGIQGLGCKKCNEAY